MADEDGNRYDAMVALNIKGVNVELEGTITDEVFNVGLTDHALDYLRNASIGNLEGAVGAIGDFLQLESEDVMASIKDYLEGFPGVGDAIKAVLEAPVYLTALEFERGNRFVLGVLIEIKVDIGIGSVDRIGFTLHRDLKS